MSNPILRARQMSLALLVIGVIDHGSLNRDGSGALPNSSGLLRLGREFMRRSGVRSPSMDFGNRKICAGRTEPRGTAEP
jgi:hypothetical protein